MPLASGLDAGASTGAHALARYRSEFPIFRDAVYLNTCSLGALGERTRRRTAEFLDLWQARGASAWYDVWWAALGALRADRGRQSRGNRARAQRFGGPVGGGRGARLPAPAQGRDHVARFSHGRLPVAREARPWRRAGGGREPGPGLGAGRSHRPCGE